MKKYCIELIVCFTFVFLHCACLEADTLAAEVISQLKIRDASNVSTNRETGEIVGVSLPRDFLDDKTMAIVARIPTLKTIQLNGAVSGTPLSSKGMAHLVAQTNLESLEIRCFSRLRPGIFSQVSRMKTLKP